jgi:hypothetical protein
VQYYAVGDIGKYKNSSMPDEFSKQGGFAYCAQTTFAQNGKTSTLVCNTGRDFTDIFRRWIDLYNIDLKAMSVRTQYTPCETLSFEENGIAEMVECPEIRYALRMRGYLSSTPQQIKAAIDFGRAGTLCLSHDADAIYWNEIKKIKQENNLTILWRLESYKGYSTPIEKVRNAGYACDIMIMDYSGWTTLEGINTNDKKSTVEYIRHLNIPVSVLFNDKEVHVVTGKEMFSVSSIGYKYFIGNYGLIGSFYAGFLLGYEKGDLFFAALEGNRAVLDFIDTEHFQYS